MLYLYVYVWYHIEPGDAPARVQVLVRVPVRGAKGVQDKDPVRKRTPNGCPSSDPGGLRNISQALRFPGYRPTAEET